jgi:hypothetical protein
VALCCTKSILGIEHVELLSHILDYFHTMITHLPSMSLSPWSSEEAPALHLMAECSPNSGPPRYCCTPLGHIRLFANHVWEHAILEDADTIAQSMPISIQSVLDDAFNHALNSMIALQYEVSIVLYTQFLGHRLTHGPELPSPKPWRPLVPAVSMTMGKSVKSMMPESPRSNSVAGPVRCFQAAGQLMSSSRR